MLHPQLRESWIARLRNESIDPVPRFAEQGIVLGAGTVLLAYEGGGRRLQRVKGQESQLLALLSAACGEVLPASVARNFERAAKSWSEGDVCLAYIHLAHARLPVPRDVRASAYRLLVAERAMNDGIAPQAILQAIKVRNWDADLVGKFDPNEPRVPAGSGKTSGEWTDSSETAEDASASTGAGGSGAQATSLLGRMSPPAASFLGELSASQMAELWAYVRPLLGPIGGAVGVFSLLFVPSPNDIHVEGEVSGVPGLRYSWNRDETLLRLIYDDPDGGRRTFSALLDGDLFRDPKGRIVGRVLSGSKVVIDAAAISSVLVDEDEPRLCPAPTKDRRTNDRGLDYENYIKSIVNPGNPTPPFMAYQLSNAIKAVTFDDCEHSTGTMVEIKDGYEGFLKDDWGRAFLTGYFWKQAMDQTSAAGARPLRWYFSQKPVADYAEEVFKRAKLGKIETVFKPKPWTGQ